MSGLSASRSAVKASGSILIISLWSLCLLATFSVILGYQARAKLTLARRLEQRSLLHFIAEAGIKCAISELKKEPEKEYDSLKDNWANNPSAFKDKPAGAGKFSLACGYVDEKTRELTARWGMVDEERKININTADIEVMKRLFAGVLDFDEVSSQELAAAIIDWRDADSQLLIPVGSAESSYYRNRVPPYEAKDAEFEILDELLLVKGMDKEMLEKLRDYVTIYGSGKININTASGAVLSALGLDSGIVDKIVSFRAGKDGLSGTEDDNVFNLASDIVPRLSQSFHLSDAEIAELSQAGERYLITYSNNFSARCIAQLNNAPIAHEVDCVINRKGRILYWREL